MDTMRIHHQSKVIMSINEPLLLICKVRHYCTNYHTKLIIIIIIIITIIIIIPLSFLHVSMQREWHFAYDILPALIVKYKFTLLQNLLTITEDTKREKQAVNRRQKDVIVS